MADPKPSLVHHASTSPDPVKTLQLYRRLAFGRKHLFATSGSDPAEYFVVNPVPQKHAAQWRPIFYRGDNPKYTPSSKAVARARRTSMWNSFRIEFGDGVHEIMENKRRKKERNSYKTKQRFRKWFCMSPTPPKKELEEHQEVKGLVMPVKMKRSRFLTRTLKWELAGREYRWTGTREFRSGWTKAWKGVSHDFKLIDSDGTVIATFEKDRWASYRRANAVEVSQNSKNKETSKLNLTGPHSGNLTEESIVFTCWMAVEAEHRLRYKILDLLEEIDASVADLTKALNTKGLTSVELVSLYLYRIGKYDCRGPSLNSVCVLNPQVFEEAQASDDYRASGHPPRPLEGIPYTVKDSFRPQKMRLS
ncbi:hypothetical protein NM208_g6381 [Fusarium decemcellulare]|uniref:Uncharacterized protein n=1 Tax=Fusarium decemcellulare TaxID=57161 RepID=A0ACC1SDD5_9HYPO|nr:hypothetical protein NM208_g6381 [Fusarium decemcellulare]